MLKWWNFFQKNEKILEKSKKIPNRILKKLIKIYCEDKTSIYKLAKTYGYYEGTLWRIFKGKSRKNDVLYICAKNNFNVPWVRR